MHDFQFVLCPGSISEVIDRNDYQRIYQFWKRTWIDTFQQLSVNSNIFSDAFTRQDCVAAILFKGEIIATTFFREVDLTQSSEIDDSYFKNWSSQSLQKVREMGEKAIICSYFSVHPEFRNRRIGISLKDMLLGLVVKYLLVSEADVLLGTPRVDRSMSEACLRWGAQLIEEDVPSGYGDTVDLIGFHKKQLLFAELPILFKEIGHLWASRIELGERGLQEQVFSMVI